MILDGKRYLVQKGLVGLLSVQPKGVGILVYTSGSSVVRRWCGDSPADQ